MLAEALGTSKTVKKVDFTSVPIMDEGLRAITQLLNASSRIAWLTLEDIGEDIKVTTWNSFFEAALRPEGKIQSLDLSRNQLSDLHLRTIANSLSRNRSLESLVLSQNSIGDLGVKILCEGLLRNTKLMLLALGCCDISNEGYFFL